MRRLQDRIAVAGKITVTLVVRYHDDNVWFIGCGNCRKKQQHCDH
jgi:hypothetical protein